MIAIWAFRVDSASHSLAIHGNQEASTDARQALKIFTKYTVQFLWHNHMLHNTPNCVVLRHAPPTKVESFAKDLPRTLDPVGDPVRLILA